MMEPEAKRPRPEDNGTVTDDLPEPSSPEDLTKPKSERRAVSAENASITLLHDLKPVRVLNNRLHDKFIAMLMKVAADGSEAVLLLEKSPFPSEWSLLIEWIESSEVVTRNDIYHKFSVTPTKGCGFSQLKVTVIHPVSQHQIAKLEAQTVHLMSESRELFDAVVRPYVEKTCLNAAWVDNILNGSAEQDRVIYSEDGEEGFVLALDLKWDGKTIEDMYCLAIVRQRGLASLRDLDGRRHLKLLRHIGNAGKRAISERYALKESQIRVYFHYPPTFYHLHLHFTHVDSHIAGQQPERAHLLDNVINNLELMPDFYQRATLTVRVQENDPLFELMSAGVPPPANDAS